MDINLKKLAELGNGFGYLGHAIRRPENYASPKDAMKMDMLFLSAARALGLNAAEIFAYADSRIARHDADEISNKLISADPQKSPEDDRYDWAIVNLSEIKAMFKAKMKQFISQHADLVPHYAALLDKDGSILSTALAICGLDTSGKAVSTASLKRLDISTDKLAWLIAAMHHDGHKLAKAQFVKHIFNNRSKFSSFAEAKKDFMAKSTIGPGVPPVLPGLSYESHVQVSAGDETIVLTAEKAKVYKLQSKKGFVVAYPFPELKEYLKDFAKYKGKLKVKVGNKEFDDCEMTSTSAYAFFICESK